MVKIETYSEVDKALESASKKLMESYLIVQPELKHLESDELDFVKRLRKVIESIEYLREEQIFTLKIKPEE